ncbi:MAG: hypothetical protein H6707_15625 [Deltaproteobacteria bacterium]|nr:hypothetical protein [Deltaproteobacteria bacterium]
MNNANFHTTRWLIGALATALLLAPIACRQSEGDRCQVTSDCEGDLICCVRPEERRLGGTCQLQRRCELTRTDAGPTDASTRDGASKDGAGKDGASKDGASKDGASKDGASKDGASTADQSTTDSAATDAAASDAQGG